MAKKKTRKIRKAKMIVSINGEELVDRVAKKHGDSARVGVPVNWIGYRVKVIRLNEKAEARGVEE